MDAFKLTFNDKKSAKEFLEKAKDITRKYLFISVADLRMMDSGHEEGGRYDILENFDEDFQYGYNKSDIRGLEIEEEPGTGRYMVWFPKPGTIVMNERGYWCAEGVGG